MDQFADIVLHCCFNMGPFQIQDRVKDKQGWQCSFCSVTRAQCLGSGFKMHACKLLLAPIEALISGKIFADMGIPKLVSGKFFAALLLAHNGTSNCCCQVEMTHRTAPYTMGVLSCHGLHLPDLVRSSSPDCHHACTCWYPTFQQHTHFPLGQASCQAAVACTVHHAEQI